MTTVTQQLTGTFTADPYHSSFMFAVRHVEVSSFRATFGEVIAQLDAGDSGLALEGRARVDSISITDPPQMRENVVNGEDFFDAANHPEITFRSTRFELGDDGTVTLDGELEIKGEARPVTAVGTYRPPIEDPYGALRAALELRTVIDRREWGMTWQVPLPGGGDALGYEVQVSINLELVKQA